MADIETEGGMDWHEWEKKNGEWGGWRKRWIDLIFVDR